MAETQNNPPAAHARILADAISGEMVARATHVNVGEEYILITEDRTYRCLNEWKRQIETKDSWIAPVCLLASLVFMFVTSSFHDTFNISKNTWEALAVVAIIFASIWTVREVYKIVISLFRKKGVAGSIEGLIDQLKKGATTYKWPKPE